MSREYRRGMLLAAELARVDWSRVYTLPPRRLRDGQLTDAHRDPAASAQHAMTAGLLAFIGRHRSQGDTRLCLAAAVAENSVAAGTIATTGGFDDIFVAPACGDAGTGVPAVLNTNLNSGWEPIVATPGRALAFFYSSPADALVINNCVVTK